MQSLNVQSLVEAVVAVPDLSERVAALERKLARLESPKGQTWLTLKETAKVLRCSEKKVSQLISAGKLRRNVHHWRVLIPAEDVESFTGKVTLPLR
jgi:excisionase family DNA binding protein